MSHEEARKGTKRLWRQGLLIAFVLVLAVVAGIIAWEGYHASRGAGLLKTLPELLGEVSKEEQRIGQIILDSYVEYRFNARNWSAIYFGCLFLSAALAASAAVVIKLEFFLKNESVKKDVAAVLAMVSALLITLSTSGDFQQKWRANRLAAAKMEKLAYAFMTADRKSSLEQFSAEIQAISYERNADIVSIEKEHGAVSPAGKK